ncbi:MAG: tRNA (adenosine(37)-N6)-threonylcarbamoyltransferase complex transferase subunit TsaD [Oscillospiraceae bacterium]|nr:tRNA (adenosine(37)-N6)-threonylcarbamoyltransferase complex transferase subunit TsaD [Oscillospiraceae bacterium]
MEKNIRILAIESSCDETAAAVVENGRTVLSSVISSQVEEHRKYGGVVPEIASRRHCENICWVVDGAMQEAHMTFDQLDAIAVTYAPGLIGALLVGVGYAKGLSMATGKPLIPVHHLRGHVAANYIAHPDLKPPFLCMIASGGHSHIVEVEDYTKFKVIGRTRDDAAGEAFDKAARAMGYPYPGGVYIDKASKTGNPKAFHLPRPHVEGSPCDFSFSGLKTAVINTLHTAQQRGISINVEDLAASFQQTVCDIISEKLSLALDAHPHDTLVLAGGVSANSGLRARLEEDCRKRGIRFCCPPLSLCGDNAAMIGAQGYYELLAGNVADLSLNAVASKKIEIE